MSIVKNLPFVVSMLKFVLKHITYIVVPITPLNVRADEDHAELA